MQKRKSVPFHPLVINFNFRYETLSEIVEYMFPPLSESSKHNLNKDACDFVESDDNQLDILDDQVRRKYKLLQHTAMDGSCDWLTCTCSLENIDRNQIIV